MSSAPAWSWRTRRPTPLASCLRGSAKHSILFVGYCDPDTPGGHLLAANNGDQFLFEAVNVKTRIRANIERFEFSGHAARNELLDFAVKCSPRSIVLTPRRPTRPGLVHGAAHRAASEFQDPRSGAAADVSSLRKK